MESITTSVPELNISHIQDAFVGERLNGTDVAIVIIYFISVLAVGLWSMWKTNRSTVKGYFLAGRSVLWWPVGASLFSSNVGSGHFIGLAGSGAASGIAVGTYEWNAMFVVLLLAWVFLPVYIASGVVTMPEYLYKRYGGHRIQTCISVVYLFIYIFTKISVDLYAGAIFINQALKWNLYYSVIALLIITALYTVGGGLAAVIYTDTLQTVIIIIGAFVLMIAGFVDVGGYSGLVTKYMNAVPTYLIANHTECGMPREDAFHVFRNVHSDFPWTGVVIGMPILSVWYWCTDQVIVQRTLAAKNLTHAKGGALFCSYLKVLPMFLMVMVGMISRAKYPDEVGCVVPEVCMKVCENSRSCSDIAYPKLVMGVLPAGARGLMMAVMLSALMSSLTSIFNSSSTIFTMDIWNRFRNKASERELMIVGRIFVLLLVAISVIWIPIIQAEEGGRLFNYIQKISAYLQPPIAVCFVLGIFWKRINEMGAFWGLCAGTLAGLVRLIVDFVYPDPVCGENYLGPEPSKTLHYLHFAILLALFTAIVTIVVSLCTTPWPDEVFGGLTWFTRHELVPANPMHSRDDSQKNEQTQLVDNDMLEQNVTYGNTSSAVTQSTDAYADVDLGRPANGLSNRQHRLPSDTVATFHVSNGGTHGLNEENEQPTVVVNDTYSLGHEDMPWWKRCLAFMCGYEGASSQPGKIHRDISTSRIQTLEEDPFWRRVVNINLLICITFALTLYIVFR
uniref:Sodium/myo-inositol cotransporter 2 n=1 Tax=Phallusia mammillata TaxID=59560 RepID=A0A6F9DT33_9ASCI|nr:sodium/glucose cotransporter 1 [Phallusia mammillata]